MYDRLMEQMSQKQCRRRYRRFVTTTERHLEVFDCPEYEQFTDFGQFAINDSHQTGIDWCIPRRRHGGTQHVFGQHTTETDQIDLSEQISNERFDCFTVEAIDCAMDDALLCVPRCSLFLQGCGSGGHLDWRRRRGRCRVTWLRVVAVGLRTRMLLQQLLLLLLLLKKAPAFGGWNVNAVRNHQGGRRRRRRRECVAAFRRRRTRRRGRTVVIVVGGTAALVASVVLPRIGRRAVHRRCQGPFSRQGGHQPDWARFVWISQHDDASSFFLRASSVLMQYCTTDCVVRDCSSDPMLSLPQDGAIERMGALLVFVRVVRVVSFELLSLCDC